MSIVSRDLVDETVRFEFAGRSGFGRVDDVEYARDGMRWSDRVRITRGESTICVPRERVERLE